jgi:hypothetical protein
MRRWILGLTFLLLAPPGAEAFCSASCPAAAGCFGECSIDTEVNSQCATACSANCIGATCRLIGGVECTYTEFVLCDRRPPKVRAQSEGSPLDSRWAILSIESGWSALLPEEAVVAASSLDFAQAAARNLAEQETDRLHGELPGLAQPRTVFIVAPEAHVQADPVLTLRDPSLKPRVDDATQFFFRAATDGEGNLVAVQPLHVSRPGTEPAFINYLLRQYHIVAASLPDSPIFFHGTLQLDSRGALTRSLTSASRISPADVSRFKAIAAGN